MSTTPEEINAAVISKTNELFALALNAVAKIEALATAEYDTILDFGDLDPLTLDKARRISVASLPSIAIGSMDTSLGEFDPNLYKSKTYVSPFFEFLEPFLTNQIETGGIGVSTEVQDALFDNTRERDLRTLSDALAKVESIGGRTGFGSSSPPDWSASSPGMSAARMRCFGRRKPTG